MRYPKIVIEVYDFVKWIIPVLSKFPKDQRYLLAQRIENKLLDILEDLIVAQYKTGDGAKLY